MKLAKKRRKLRVIRPDTVIESEKSREDKSRNLKIKVITIIGIVCALLLAIYLFCVYRTYNNYKVRKTIKIETGTNSQYQAFGEFVVKYSNDGISYINGTETIWNEAYEMKSPIVDVCGDYLAIADKNSNTIYIFNKKGKVGEVNTSYPIIKIEVAQQGSILSTLSNPYGIATVFHLNSEETKRVVPIARSLIGARSGVVIKTPTGDVKERSIKAGTINIIGLKKEVDVDVDEGADKIMEAISVIQDIDDIQGETGTNAGNMLNNVRRVMAGLTNKEPKDIKIQDLLAVDTFNPQKVVGGIADEFALENAVGIAAMVKSDRLQMEMIANVLTEKLKVPVYVGGVEADMAIKGALTTPGTSVPLAIVDMGAGSTDASIINREGKVKLVHLAGAGNMVSLLIQSELGLDTIELAEDVKKYTLAKVESLFHIRHENGTVQFFDKPLDPSIFAKVVLVKENDELVPLDGVESLEKVKQVRMDAKKKVFVRNAIRSLAKVSPTGNPRDIQFVVMVGGSALDFEIPNFVTDALADYDIVAGRGNIRGCEGPRNAVATGLAMACVTEE